MRRDLHAILNDVTSPSGRHPPERTRHDAVPGELPWIVGGEPERTERQLRDVDDLVDVELRDVVSRSMVVRVLTVEELHDGDSPLEIGSRIRSWIVVRGSRVLVPAVERDERELD